ncbi:hypothetical protein P7C73_g20, partial [Tremellales sp. Uapishka_1]
MAIVEVVADDPVPERSSQEVLRVLQQLSVKLRLPAELLPSFLIDDEASDELAAFQRRTLRNLRETATTFQTAREQWSFVPIEEQAEIYDPILRLYTPTPSPQRMLIDEITSHTRPSELALYLLRDPLRALFTPTPHPLLNPTTSRALSRPAGGPNANSDFHDTPHQLFKSPAGWGSYNVLFWCISQLKQDEMEKHIGVILPPTLILMDDYEPVYRSKGLFVLGSWIRRLANDMLIRMGIGKLILASLIHTLSLNANPPIKGVLPLALELIDRLVTKPKDKAERIEEVVDKGLIKSWIYAPSGVEGRVVLIDVSERLEILCGSIGISIVRWLKTIIPFLLEPLQYTPSPAVLPHYKANLRALLTLMQTLSGSGRLDRWRGKILDVLSRLWINLNERGGVTGNDTEIRTSIQAIFIELESQCPSVREVEYPQLLDLDKTIFSSLIPTSSPAKA